MKNLLKVGLVAVALFMLGACGSDDEATSVAAASYRATINGVQWEATNFKSSNGLIQLTATNEQIFQLSGDDDIIRLELYLTASQISSCMSVGSYEFPNRVDISYKQDGGGFVGGHIIDTNTDGSRVMTLNVTSCNNNVISGNFTASYTGNSGPNAPENIVITNGIFENITFVTVQQ